MRNTLLFYVLTWIAELNDVHKIGIYCSHMAGASDRLDSELLICKLEPFGFSEKLVNVIRKLLRQRQGFVIVTEQKSSPMPLSNMVFQETVWGPRSGMHFWRLHLGDF